jgi:hypothetical protein
MTRMPRKCRLPLNFVTKAGIRLIITGLVITCVSCFPFDRDCNPPPPREKGGILRMLSVPLKDGGHADIRLEKLTRTYSYCPGWFQGAGGQPGGEETHYYLIVDGTVDMPSGKTSKFTWIGPYMKHWTSPYFIPRRLVLSSSDVFIEYAAIPTTQNAQCIDLVKRRKFNGTKIFDQKDTHNPLFNYNRTYKWKDEYLWENVTKEAFDQATGSGDVISLRAGWDAANDVCYAWSKDCFTHCLEELDRPEAN